MKILTPRVACLLLVIPSMHAAEPARPDATVLPVVVVIDRPISELRCSIRFRHHLPGAGMKELVITKVPSWCAAKGLGLHDRIVGIDGHAIDGQGMVSFIKTLAAKFGQPPVKPTHFVFEVRPQGAKTVRKVEVVFDDSRNFTVAYP